jgi:hypothetical protein
LPYTVVIDNTFEHDATIVVNVEYFNFTDPSFTATQSIDFYVKTEHPPICEVATMAYRVTA